ncbi:MAG: response regulator [Elusimicrobiota bacterium]
MNLRLLVVEDNIITRAMLKEMLGMLGHQVVAEADTLQSALEQYQKHRPDAVSLDLSLAQDDGLVILKALRQADPQASVFVVSANCQKRLRDQLIASGAFDIIAKPIELEALKSCLERIATHGNKPTRPENHPPTS